MSYADDVLFGWRGVCIGCRRWRCAQLIYEDDDNITDLTPRNCSDYCWADQVWSVGPVAAGSGPVASPPYTAAAQAALLFCVAAHRRAHLLCRPNQDRGEPQRLQGAAVATT